MMHHGITVIVKLVKSNFGNLLLDNALACERAEIVRAHARRHREHWEGSESARNGIVR